MLLQTIILEGAAIKHHVCEPISAAPKVELSPENASALLRLLRFSKEEFFLPQTNQPFIFQVIHKRLEAIGVVCDDHRAIMAMSLLCTTPAHSSVMCWYFKFKMIQHGLKKLDIEAICNQIIPDGWISDETFSEIWSRQKIDNSSGGFSDNLVDYLSAGEFL